MTEEGGEDKGGSDFYHVLLACGNADPLSGQVEIPGTKTVSETDQLNGPKF